MNQIVILTGGRNGMASWCLPRLVSDQRFKVAGVIFSRSEIVNKKRYVLRRLKKILRIGVLGALNGIRIRKWYHDAAEDLFVVCKKYSIPLYQVSSLYGKDLPELLNQLNPDLGVSLGNGYIPERVFSIPQYGMINVHSEIVPAYQNAQSIIWPIYFNDPYTGFTIHQISVKMDAGRILFQKKIPIAFKSTLEATVRHNREVVNRDIPSAVADVCALIRDAIENGADQGPGNSYTTPSIWQFMRMMINNRRFYRMVNHE